ncbi:MAG: DUF552 domain-containing protein [Actinobacteria bacterium]|jgi:cell division inhibitor SepF|nr:DUF552 domain-containing protein [Actinomycetota bacterium]NBP92007.1 DUF552 domain-containing protein [Actinomycetota bacterium]
MANSMRKMAKYLGLVDADEMLEGEAVIEETQVMRRPAFDMSRVRRETPHPEVSDVRTVAPIAPSHVEPIERPLNKIVTLHPRNYNEAKTIGEHYRQGVPVIMNVTDMTDADAKRLVDFGAGLAFGLHGSIERVTQKVFLISPANVSVSLEEKSAAAEASFFNQS